MNLDDLPIETNLEPKLEARHWTDFPAVSGTYCVSWYGWKTLLPVYMEWDGEQWVDLDAKRKHYKIALSKKHAELGVYYPGDFFWLPNNPGDVKGYEE